MKNKSIYKVISADVRRKIINHLTNKSMSVNSIAANFEISRPAISRHLRVLHQSGLIKMKKSGRNRYCYLNHLKLSAISNWVNRRID